MNKKYLFSLIIVLMLLSMPQIYSIGALRIENKKDVEIYSLSPSDVISNFDQEDFEIIYPLCTIPELVEIDDNFIIQFSGDDFDDVFAYISTAYEPVTDEIWLDIIDFWQDGSIWNLEVHIPNDVPEELYNLSLMFEKDDEFITCVEPRSIDVNEEISDTFSFIHITDLHYGDPRGFVESIEETIGFKSIKRCIKEINILQPDFVIISGDLVFGQLYPFEYKIEYDKLYELMQTFDVPTFIAPGNHDGYNRILEDGLEFWEEYFGPLYYSYDYGDYHFISVNSYDMSKILRLCILFIPLNWGGSISNNQLNWIEQDLMTADSENIFMFMHHNPIFDTRTESLMFKEYENREELISLINEYNVDMVLAGHNHLDTVNIIDDVIYITTTTPESEISSEDGYWGYRLIEINDGEITSYNYKEPKYSIPSYHLDYNISYSGDSAIGIVENDLEIDVDVILKFNMPLGVFEVDNGVIILQRDDDNNSEIYVKVNVEALSDLSIMLSSK